MIIQGTTSIIGMIGDPISKARTPGLLNPQIAASGKDLAIVPFHILAHAAGSVLPALLHLGNLSGLIITYPFKETCLAFADHLSTAARLVGGVNAMRREVDGTWTGEIFDGIGLLNAVRKTRDPEGTQVTLIGAGGAGRAIAASFAEAGVAGITVIDLDPDRANGLVESLAKTFPGQRFCSSSAADEANADIIINASPVGMNPNDGLPCEVLMIEAGMTVVDIVPASEPTALMRRAAASGATVIPGKAMTEGQADAMLNFFGISG